MCLFRLNVLCIVVRFLPVNHYKKLFLPTYHWSLGKIFSSSSFSCLRHPRLAVSSEAPPRWDSDWVTLLGAILNVIESLTCGTHTSVVPHVSGPTRQWLSGTEQCHRISVPHAVRASLDGNWSSAEARELRSAPARERGRGRRGAGGQARRSRPTLVATHTIITGIDQM
jgi:hypothetical protein